ncbi:MAG: ArsR family transcriptional regulator, partial [Desulfobacteraceae bacterium]|nr:ArsR family transcriptional regulator [Desulfobacteraceae bacterium]
MEKTLVGSDRWEILNNILKELTIKNGETPKQHWMLVGPRGIGKSHLMTLLYFKIKDASELNKLWIPVLFPEELRLATNLSKFLERTVNEILIELEQEKNQISEELKQKIIKVRNIPISERIDSFFSLISWLHEKTGKFIVLITENLQQLLGKKLPLIEQKKLRAFLQTSDALLIIGSATTIFNALHDHSHPFYHFFHIRRMEDLEFGDMKTLIVDLLSESGSSEFAKDVIVEDARLKTLYAFTGGNPRMAVFLSDILKTQISDEMLNVMDIILDELTPYFEAILKEIPDYLQEIVNTLATFEPAQSPKEISYYLEAPQPTIRNYMKQLKENGYVRIAFSKGKSNYYCLNEYLYRIWYQMRDSSHREETRWIMELLLMLYSPTTIVKERSKVNAIINAERPSTSYEELIVQTADFVTHNPDYCKIIELCIDSTINDEKGIVTNTEEK